MPDHLQEYRKTWIAHHPGWEFHLWGEADLEWLQNWDLFDNASRWTEHTGQFRSDIARYEILHRFGGVYVDCDVECLKPIDELLGFNVFVVRENAQYVGNTVIGATAQHRLFRDLVDGLPSRVVRTEGRGWRPNRITGPHYFTTKVARHQHDRGLRVLPAETFLPYAWNELDRDSEDFPNSYGVHHWENQRKLKGRPRD